ncbi:hypothetical protein ABVK25_010462 [Lepraria finkii]|uniref:DyP dimeric alpha+beta barrel domain-containing protein n=1 Tax=Lepraria finkii TaxID=1340010 RepID=A0ABR4AUR1_9LECA
MSSPAPPPLDLRNVQGDILAGGLPKKIETCYFFRINDAYVHEFRTQLGKLVPLITSTAEVINDQRRQLAQNKKDAAEKKITRPLLKISGVNISFSTKGLKKMGITDEIGDTAFDTGMLAGAKDLGDIGTSPPNGPFDPDWIPAFKQDIDGLILITGDSYATVAEKLAEIEKILLVQARNPIIHEVIRLVGDVRSGKVKGHEHFGFQDGISNPAVADVDANPNPGQQVIPQGIILLGRPGDAPTLGTPPVPVTRPPWALDGSFLSFRYLFQLVPEFNTFLKNNPIPITGLTREQGSELLGARLVGRWKSGAPVDLAPLHDDPALGQDPLRNNNFHYTFPDDQQTQTRCPFAAHLRKTNPRGDLDQFGPNALPPHRIIRSGIAFGPEVSAVEAASEKTHLPRGLLFIAYQSNIEKGFQFIQQSWSNTIKFPPNKPANQIPGFDPIIGQTNDGGVRTLSGTNPNNQTANLNLLKQWVVPKGGEYFFSPSIPALKETFALTEPSSELKS